MLSTRRRDDPAGWVLFPKPSPWRGQHVPRDDTIALITPDRSSVGSDVGPRRIFDASARMLDHSPVGGFPTRCDRARTKLWIGAATLETACEVPSDPAWSRSEASRSNRTADRPSS